MTYVVHLMYSIWGRIPRHWMVIVDFGYRVYALWFYCFQTLNSLTFQSFDFERTWWKLFQKHVVRTKFDIYVYIIWHLIVKTICQHIIVVEQLEENENTISFLFKKKGMYWTLIECLNWWLWINSIMQSKARYWFTRLCVLWINS